MTRSSIIVAVAALLTCSWLPSVVRGQTMAGPFNGPYTLVNLGSVPGVTTRYGGLCFLDNNTLLIGGEANVSSGKIFRIGVVRNASNRITGFTGTATLYKNAPDIDGGLTFDSNGVLLCTTYISNNLLMYRAGGGINPDKTINLTPLGVASSTGAIVFVPPGFPGAGGCRILSYSSDNIYSCTLTPDGLGTYNISAVTLQGAVAAGSGPEGWVFVPAGSPVFNPANQYGLFPEYGANRVSAYQLSPTGYPMVGTRVDFVSGLTGAEGGVLDPVTNDFLFSTFGGTNQVILVSGFEPPTPPPPPPPPPPPSGPPPNPFSEGEGDYPGATGPPARPGNSMVEGGYGFGGGRIARAGAPALLNPILRTPRHTLKSDNRVFNVSHDRTPRAMTAEPAGGFGPAGWTLFSGLALATTAFLAVRYRQR